MGIPIIFKIGIIIGALLMLLGAIIMTIPDKYVVKYFSWVPYFTVLFAGLLTIYLIILIILI